MTKETRLTQLNRLADRIAAGKVVFFIGAGFSLDSEGNSGKILILRLLVRFEAMCRALEASDSEEFRGAAEIALKLRTTLRTIFNLKAQKQKRGGGKNTAQSLFTDDLAGYLDILSHSYFQINDWMCGAFEELLDRLPEKIPDVYLESVRKLEDDLLGKTEALVNSKKIPGPAAAHRPGELDLHLLKGLSVYCENTGSARTERAVAGKALFLDTMGFAEERVMGGAPMAQSLDEVVAESAGRLRDRHHALAWLAAEGLCPALVTTNFDLLLESAYRLAGLLPLNPPPSKWSSDEASLKDAQSLRMPLNHRYGYFARITYASQFFCYGEAWQAVQIYKIHGCVDAYRITREKAKADPREDGYKLMRTVLPTMVFTFREIQNWREDTWSRDHLNTLLRTRTIAFSGYSGADPVIHDTFRTIYEEMAGYHIAMVTKAAPMNPGTKETGPNPDMHAGEQALQATFPSPQKDADTEDSGTAATAFLLGPSGEFHGLEILRAASMATGTRRPELTSHPNLITFHIGQEPPFPNLDEVYVWLYHLLARKLQKQALATQLHHTYYQLMGHRCPGREANAICESFRELLVTEERLEGGSDGNGSSRDQFRRITGWTWFFHRALLREYALAENFLRSPIDGLSIQRVANLPWYCPISEHPGWAAWGVIMELAIRRAYGAICPSSPPEGWKENPALTPVPHTCPTLALSRQGKVKRALSIEIASFQRMFKRRQPSQFLALPPVRWEIRNETVPWWRNSGDPEKDSKPNGGQWLPPATPSARTLWEWAVLPEDAWMTRPEKYFGQEESSDEEKIAK